MPKKAIPTQEGPQSDGTTWKLVNRQMRLIDRRPEWPEQDKRDREAYGLPQSESLPMSVFLEVHPEESQEHAFRRGYAYGWLHALDVFMALAQDEQLTLDEAYRAMYRFAKREELRQWVDGDCRVQPQAPNMYTAAVAKEIREQRGKEEVDGGD